MRTPTLNLLIPLADFKMIYIAKLPTSFLSLKRLKTQNLRWVYIGKSAANRDKIGDLFGAGNRIYLGSRLQEIAEQLRKPFLDFIAEMGKEQQDKTLWWCTRVSWRDWGVSDLFLHFCYLRLIESIITGSDEAESSRCLIIENQWLFAQLKRNYSHHEGIQFIGKPLLMLDISGLFLRGLVVRLILPFRVMWAKFLQYYYCRTESPRAVCESGDYDVAIYSLQQPRCFTANDSWNDPFFPDLDAFLQGKHVKIRRFSPPFPFGYERQIAKRSDLITALILFVKLGDVIQSIFKWWKREEIRKFTFFSGMPIELLIENEWWNELAHTQLCRFIIFKYSLDRFFQQCKIKTVLYPFENQPWEKMLCSSAKSFSIRTVGYQHSTVPRFYLTQFPGEGEINVMPLPDVLMVSGPYTYRLFREAGYPEGMLCCGGSWRYKYLNDNSSSIYRQQKIKENEFKEILMLMPIDYDLCLHMISALENKLGKCKFDNECFKLYMKPHPMTPLKIDGYGIDIEVTDMPLDKALNHFDVIIYSGTTAGLEAKFLNKKVLRYKPEIILDVDPSDAIPDQILEIATDDDLLQKTMHFVNTNNHKASDISLKKLRKDLFASLIEERWVELFLNPKVHCSQDSSMNMYSEN